jgi:hypothetical protein
LPACKDDRAGCKNGKRGGSKMAACMWRLQRVCNTRTRRALCASALCSSSLLTPLSPATSSLIPPSFPYTPLIATGHRAVVDRKLDPVGPDLRLESERLEATRSPGRHVGDQNRLNTSPRQTTCTSPLTLPLILLTCNRPPGHEKSLVLCVDQLSTLLAGSALGSFTGD